MVSEMLNKHKQLLLVLTIALVLYFSLVGFWTGFHAKMQIQSYIKSKTGLTLAIGLTYIYPFTGNGVIKNIRLPNPDGFFSKKAFSIDEIRFKGSSKTIYGETSQIESMTIRGVQIHFEPKEGGNNFRKIFTSASAFYKGDESDHDLGFKRIYIKHMEIDPIHITLGPTVLGKSVDLVAIELDEVGTAENGIGMYGFGRLLLEKYRPTLEKSFPELSIPKR